MTDFTRWYACANPERRPDADMEFHVHCRACQIAARAAITVEPRPGEFRGWFDQSDAVRRIFAAGGVDL